MNLASWVRFARQVRQPGDPASRSAIAIFALGERVLSPIAVNVAVLGGFERAIVVGALLSAIFALRGFLQSAHVARTEAGLYVRVVHSVLEQDVLQSSVLPDHEALATLFESAHGVARLLAEGLANLSANFLAAAVFAVFLAFAEPARVVVVAAAAGVAGMLMLGASRGNFEAAQETESSAWAEMADDVSDAFDGRLEIVAAGRTNTYVKSFEQIASSWRKARLHAALVSRLVGRLPLLVLALSVGAAVMLESVLRGQSVGRIVGQAALLASMSPAFVGSVQGVLDLGRNKQRLARLQALVTGNDRTSAQGALPPANVRSIELRDVHFTYQRDGHRHEALRGLCLSWNAGEVLALAGPNGSGKSTCLRVLLGLARPSAGDVLVDGISLQSIDLPTWRRGVVFLPQRPYLPPRVTVRESLRFIDADVSDEVMLRAAERLELTAAFGPRAGSLLDVPVDDLSVGLRQRVALARVLCRRARLVVLDEPDANLDHSGVQLVAALVRELAREHMVIVVAHSPELLGVADRVVFIEAGQVSKESARSVCM